MRTIAFMAVGILAGGMAFAASQSETITYVDGNVKGVSPHTGGTLVYSDPAALMIRTSGATIKVPYSTISKAELGGTLSHSHDAPLYKVWALPNRVFSKKTQTKYLTVDFKNEAGESRTMTIEVAETSASKILSTIDSHKATTEASSAASPAPATETAALTEASPAADAPQTVASNTSPSPSVPVTAKPSSKSKRESSAAAAKQSDSDWLDGLWKTPSNASKWPQTGPVAAGGQE